MLKKRFRLKSPFLFRRTLAARRLCSTACFAVYALPKAPISSQTVSASAKSLASGPLPRFGLIVSRKVHKRAVRRNRIKRRLREIIRLDLLAVERAKPLDQFTSIVVVVRAASVDASYQDLRRGLLACFR